MPRKTKEIQQDALHKGICFLLKQPYDGVILLPTLQGRKLRFCKLNKPAQLHS